MTTAAPHAPDYRPLAGNDDLTCADCYESWPCRTERRRRHLSTHLTDGQWHDECHWCRYRRVHGGTGVTDANA